MQWQALGVPACGLGESPVWHPVARRLFWCDIPAGTLHSADLQGQAHTSWDIGDDLACIAPVVDGTVLLATRSAILHFDPSAGRRRAVAEVPYDSATQRFNDGKVDPLGRWWLGTLYDPRTSPEAAVYCLEGTVSALQVRRRAGGITVSNGMAFAPDGLTIYRSDTTSHQIFRTSYVPETGETGAWEVWAQRSKRLPEQPLASYGGRPDGAAVDTQGCYWSAMYEGRCLVRYAPTGEVLEEVSLPVQCPTMPCFAGDDLQTLVVTTARDKRPAGELADQPWAGHLLLTRVPVPGLPAHCMRA